MKLPYWIGLLIASFGLFVFASWQDPHVVAGLIPGLNAMKPLSAILFVISGALLTYLSNYARSRYRDEIGTAISVALIVFGVLSGMDSYKGGPGMVAMGEPGTGPSFVTLLAFTLYGLWGFAESGPTIPTWKQSLPAVLCMGIGLVSVIGYLTSTPVLYFQFNGLSTAMSLPTALLFLLLGISANFLTFTKPHPTLGEPV